LASPRHGKVLQVLPEILGSTLTLRDTGFMATLFKKHVDAERRIDAKALELIQLQLVYRIRDNKANLNVRFMQFNNVVIELLQYRAADQKPGTVGSFAPLRQFTSPAFPNNMHISFQVADTTNLMSSFEFRADSSCTGDDECSVQSNHARGQ